MSDAEDTVSPVSWDSDGQSVFGSQCWDCDDGSQPESMPGLLEEYSSGALVSTSVYAQSQPDAIGPSSDNESDGICLFSVFCFFVLLFFFVNINNKSI